MVDHTDPMWKVTPIQQLLGRSVREIVEIEFWCLGGKFTLIVCEQGDLFMTGSRTDEDKGPAEWLVHTLTIHGRESREWQDTNRPSLLKILTPEQMKSLDDYWAVETDKAEERAEESYRQRITHFTDRLEELQKRRAQRQT